MLEAEALRKCRAFWGPAVKALEIVLALALAVAAIRGAYDNAGRLTSGSYEVVDGNIQCGSESRTSGTATTPCGW